MPCCGDREKGPVGREEKWDSVNLDDFKSDSCLTPFSYFLVYVFLLISIAVYAVDTFTAVNLLAFSRWAGSIEPAIPFTVSRWIFAVCIIISFVLLFLRWLHAIRAMRSGSIARSYLDPLAARVQSIRMGKRGRGWRRFLVFAELTKSKKGAEYVALFAYFSFESWMNTIFADGPRQVVNAITLYSVMKMDLLPGGQHTVDDDKPGIVQFFENFKILAEDNNQRTVVLCGMLFTLVIWVLSILKLASAVVLYLIFLWHHIPSQDGSLNAYCRRKINSRLMRVVRRKVDKALAKSTLNRAPTEPNLGLDRKPTLPLVVDMNVDDKTPTVTTLSRSTTQTTLPPYTSRPGTAAPERNPALPTLPDVSWAEKPALSRTVTASSAHSDLTSFSGATAGYSPLDRGSSPAPPVPPVPSSVPMPGARSYTPVSRPPTTRPTRTPAPPSADAPSHMPTAMSQGDYEEGPRRYPDPYSTDAPYDENYGAYQSYKAAPDPYSRSLTRGAAVSSGEDYPSRTLTPQSRGTPQPPPNQQPSYPMRSYTPGNAGPPRPPLAVDTAGNYSERTFSPVSQRATPRPQQQSPQQQGGYVAFDPSSTAQSQPSPASQRATPRPQQQSPQQQGGYVAFDPSSVTSSQPPPVSQRATPRPQQQGPQQQGSYAAFDPSSVTSSQPPPVSQRATPRPQQQGPQQQGSYAAFDPSSVTSSQPPPVSQRATPRPQQQGPQQQGSYAAFDPSSVTSSQPSPASQRATPRPQQQSPQQQGGYVAFDPSSVTSSQPPPVSQRATPRPQQQGPQQQGGYVAFDPSSVTSSQPPPVSQRATPRPQQQGPQQQGSYAAFDPSSVTSSQPPPVSQRATPRPQQQGPQQQGSYAAFDPSSVTSSQPPPVSQRATPRPQQQGPQQQGSYAAFDPSSVTSSQPPPVSQRATPRPQQQGPQQQGSYAAFDPSSMTPSQPKAGVRPSNSPVYHAYGGPGSATSPNQPSNRPPPVRAYTPQGYNPQPRPYQQDYS